MPSSPPNPTSPLCRGTKLSSSSAMSATSRRTTKTAISAWPMNQCFRNFRSSPNRSTASEPKIPIPRKPRTNTNSSSRPSSTSQPASFRASTSFSSVWATKATCFRFFLAQKRFTTTAASSSPIGSASSTPGASPSAPPLRTTPLSPSSWSPSPTKHLPSKESSKDLTSPSSSHRSFCNPPMAKPSGSSTPPPPKNSTQPQSAKASIPRRGAACCAPSPHGHSHALDLNSQSPPQSLNSFKIPSPLSHFPSTRCKLIPPQI